MKNILAIELFKYLYYIKQNFSKKNPKLIYPLNKLAIINIPDVVFYHNSPIMRDNMCDLTNLINSGHTNLISILIWYLGEFIKTNVWINLSEKKLMERFKKEIIFYMYENYINQCNIIQKKLDQYNSLPTLIKKTKKDIFTVDDIDQKNELYQLVKDGIISFIIYAKILKKGTFLINKYNINDLEMIRYLKIIDEIKEVEVKKIEVK